MSVGYAQQFVDFVDFTGVFGGSLQQLCNVNLDQLPAVKCFYAAQNVVKQLQRLNSSFFSVIFQEGLKAFQKEEPSGIIVSKHTLL